MTFSTRLSLVLLVTLFLNVGIARAQAGKNMISHGTVNVFLGNENGLVAVTDSRLSSNGKPAGYGQKLFKLDDHTICSIAGFFSNNGPTFAGDSPNPLSTAVAPMLEAYIGYVWPRQSGPLATKFYTLARSWALDLDLMEEVQQISKLSTDTPVSVLTIAGYDSGVLLVGQITLTPTLIDGKMQYVFPADVPILKPVVGKHVTEITAGIDSLAKNLLKVPTHFANYDPIFRRYAESETANGSPLSLDELQTLANRIERMTADKYSSEVGGLPQIAVLSNGKALLYPPIVPFPAVIDERKSVLEFHKTEFIFDTLSNKTPGLINLFVDDYFYHCTIDLERMIIVRSTFNNCTFIYKNSPIVLFDDTNNISDSKLVLSADVPDDSKIVKTMKAIYPKILILRDSPKTSTHP